MKKILIILSLICSAYVCYAQVADDFSDDDLTNNPTWTPNDANNWTVVSGQLRSNSATASSSFYITTPSAKATQAQWDFYVQLQFNTSSANFVDVYLISEQADLLSVTNNGYFVRIGGTPDEISLYKMTAGIASILINGTDGITNRSNNPLQIKVIRDANNSWSLERDALGGTDYILEGNANDNSFSVSSYFGIRVQQSTATFFNKHFFDNLYAGDIVVEKDPPVLNDLKVLSNTQLSLLFSEPLNATSTQTTSHYNLSNGIGNPTLAELQSDEKTVLLTFSQSFTNGVTHLLDVSGVQDMVGNSMVPVGQSFLFFQPMPVNAKDIILTEFLADPTPQIGLPEAEFIEIYNRSSNPINLDGWKFSDGNSVATFTAQIILPNQYWVICASANASLFSASPHILGVSNFPTLNNTGESLTLKTNEGLLIDSLNYSLAWYRDEDKQEGGWTLELIDINNPCGEEDNWAASEDPKGGTPGKVNSITANKPDLIGPKLLSVTVVNPNELVLRFDEKLEMPLSTVTFNITPSINVNASLFTSLSLREIKLVLGQDLSSRQLYNLEITNLRDCNGNFIQEDFNQLSFALPEAAVQGDVLINEILFNPRAGGVDFVEIINLSSKYINLKGWSLANREEELSINLKLITDADHMLEPHRYLVLTSDGGVIKNEYPTTREENLFSTSLPSMSDDEGSIAVISNEGLLLDYFVYDEGYHSQLLKDKEGVSLERIFLTEPTNLADNWKSANSASGYATPGYLNSNSRPENPIDENAVRIEPEIFAPTVPGQNFAQISYRFDQSALAANIKIVDQQGRLIKEVANNETLGYEGFFRWDGDRDDGSKAKMGYYFVWFEVFDLDGIVKTYRKRVVVGR
jgi:Lamin Tail Domain/Bacterial Ig-like domain